MATPPPLSSSTRGDLDILRLVGADAVLEVTSHGAHVLAWEPVHTQPVLFVSPQSHYRADKAIRGGVPVIFPWFGAKANDPKAAQHGFARVRSWQVTAADRGVDGNAVAVFSLGADVATRSAWAHEFAAEFSARAGRELKLALNVRNTGNAPFTFEAALHTYFAVSDVRAISVHGLERTAFLERYGDGHRQTQGDAPITFAGEVDRTFFDTSATCVIADPAWRRRIVIAKAGSRTTVVWNPGAEKARAMADLGDPAWTGFVCVETVCAGADAVTLAPGAVHELGATVAVEQE